MKCQRSLQPKNKNIRILKKLDSRAMKNKPHKTGKTLADTVTVARKKTNYDIY